MNFHVSRAGEVIGSYSVEEIRARMATGEFSPADFYWKDGMQEWKLLADFSAPPHLHVSETTDLPYIIKANGKKHYTRATWVDIIICLILPILGFFVSVIAFCKGEGKRGAITLGLTFASLTFYSFLFPEPNATQSPSQTNTNNYQPNPQSQPRIESLLLSATQVEVDKNKDGIFSSIHPVGKAVSIVVHDITVTQWKNNLNTNRLEDIIQYDVRLTLYWKAPLVENGFTKVNYVFDNESQRFLSSQILATNGITHENTGEAIGAIFETWLDHEARKAAYERVLREQYR